MTFEEYFNNWKDQANHSEPTSVHIVDGKSINPAYVDKWNKLQNDLFHTCAHYQRLIKCGFPCQSCHNAMLRILSEKGENNLFFMEKIKNRPDFFIVEHSQD